MDKAFLAAYVDLLIKTCHKRGAYAIGGMSAFIPVRDDERANEAAFEKVRADKEREVRLGHDGTWVAHPALVQLAREVFDSGMKGPNQLEVLREDVNVTRDDLLRVPEGEITEAGVRADISVALQYLGSWLSGKGCVPINNLMEDAATAEISRAQLWQWIRHGASLSGGRKVTLEMVKADDSRGGLASHGEGRMARDRPQHGRLGPGTFSGHSSGPQSSRSSSRSRHTGSCSGSSGAREHRRPR